MQFTHRAGRPMRVYSIAYRPNRGLVRSGDRVFAIISEFVRCLECSMCLSGVHIHRDT